MDAWQFISLGVAAALSRLYWLERKKRIEATLDRDKVFTYVLARHEQDERTGLMAPDSLDKALKGIIQEMDKVGGTCTVLAVALDNFEMVKDGFGEEVGVDILKIAAQRIVSSTGSDAVVGMGEGEEFVLVIRGDAKIGSAVAARIKEEISKPYKLDTDTTRLTCSVGIAVYPEHGVSSTIIANAAYAMRSLKSSGGAGYCIYNPKTVVQARDEAVLVNELRTAVTTNQFELYFQPKIDARTLQVTAAEALIRWHHPTRGLVSPVIFIPLAEKYGLMESIGKWVIEEACHAAEVWLESGLRMRVAVNISGYQMRQIDLVEHIEETLKRHGLQAERFTCEITETVAMEDTQATKLTFEKMREAGFHVSIDDFGTGYSSLASLRRLPAAELKMDRAFVTDLEESEEARSIAKSIIEMARALNLKVIAEGVETVGQSDILVAMGCDEMQGYLFSMPIPAKDLCAMAMNRHSGDSSGFRDSLFATDFSTLGSN